MIEGPAPLHDTKTPGSHTFVKPIIPPLFSIIATRPLEEKEARQKLSSPQFWHVN
jgi:hypothetical protein